MRSIMKYLIGLNPIAGSNKLWLPAIEASVLEQIEHNNNNIAIAHDWFSLGSYEYGLCTIVNGVVTALQEHPKCSIANPNFIFEMGTLDHKGLIAIEIPPTVKTFIMETGGWDEEQQKAPRRVYFLPNEDEIWKQSVIELVNESDVILSIIDDERFIIDVKDYRDIIESIENINLI